MTRLGAAYVAKPAVVTDPAANYPPGWNSDWPWSSPGDNPYPPAYNPNYSFELHKGEPGFVAGALGSCIVEGHLLEHTDYSSQNPGALSYVLWTAAVDDEYRLFREAGGTWSYMPQTSFSYVSGWGYSTYGASPTFQFYLTAEDVEEQKNITINATAYIYHEETISWEAVPAESITIPIKSIACYFKCEVTESGTDVLKTYESGLDGDQTAGYTVLMYFHTDAGRWVEPWGYQQFIRSSTGGADPTTSHQNGASPTTKMAVVAPEGVGGETSFPWLIVHLASAYAFGPCSYVPMDNATYEVEYRFYGVDLHTPGTDWVRCRFTFYVYTSDGEVLSTATKDVTYHDGEGDAGVVHWLNVGGLTGEIVVVTP